MIGHRGPEVLPGHPAGRRSTGTSADGRQDHPCASTEGNDVLMRLQSTAGNRAVLRLVAPVQREDAVDAGPAPGPASGVDDDLEAVLEEISASLPPTEEVEAWIDEIASQPVTRTPEVPHWEAITSTTAGEYSRGELEQRIMRSWRRHRLGFTEAARRAARRDVAHQPRAVKSRASGEAPYDLRWGLTLLAADYSAIESPSLPDVAALLREGSPFQAALDGSFDRVLSVGDPSGADITSSIDEAVFAMFEALELGSIGQLVVAFSGHGGDGAIQGVDGEVVLPHQLRELAEHAATFKVHVVYVLDTCRAGTLVMHAQGAELTRLEDRIDELPADRRDDIEALAEYTRELGRRVHRLGVPTIDLGDAIRAYRRARRRGDPTDEHQLAIFEALAGLSETSTALQQALESRSLPDEAPEATPVLAHIEALDRGLTAAMMSFGPRPPVRVLRRVAVVLDETADHVNALLAFTARAIAEAAANGGATADAGSGTGAGVE